MSRRRRAALAVVVALATAFGCVPASAALSWQGPDPARNIAPSPSISGSVCDSDPHSDACRLRLTQALAHGRAATGLPNYGLPDRFAYLSAREKLLVLTNQDRAAKGLSPVVGMNYWLNHNAQLAIPGRLDPAPIATLAGAHWSLWTANWAGGNGASENPLFAYYNWMYYDGLNANGTSWNLLCHPYDRTYCWKHRHNILVKPSPRQQLVIGIGAGADGHGWLGFTQLVETFPSSAAVNYIPTVVRVSARVAPHSGGKVVTLGGFGFVHITQVTVLGKNAQVLSHDPWHLTIRVPANRARSGYIVVHTLGGTSSKNYAAAFQYAG